MVEIISQATGIAQYKARVVYENVYGTSFKIDANQSYLKGVVIWVLYI